jgi:hypothetical protein
MISVIVPFALNASAASDPNFHIYLYFGQSYMESGGQMNDMDRTVDKRFHVLADFDSTNRSWIKDQWYEVLPPLAARGSGICMVDYFGRTIVAALPEKIRVGVVSEGSREFGKRYGEKMLSLLRPSSTAETK